MKNTKILFLITFVCLMSLTNIFAQTETLRPQPQADTSYEVVLHILTASNNPTVKSSVPQSLSNVVKKLKTVYSYSNYSLDSTFFERVSNSSNFSFKGVSQENAANQENYVPIFSEWGFQYLESLPNGQGKNSIQMRGFNFGQRIPIKYSANSPTNYEQIGLIMKSMSLPENIPTIIGSLSGAKPDELIFLILTVKPAE